MDQETRFMFGALAIVVVILAGAVGAVLICFQYLSKRVEKIESHVGLRIVWQPDKTSGHRER